MSRPTIDRPDPEQHHRHDVANSGSWGQLHQCTCGEWFFRAGDKHWSGDRWWSPISDRKAKRIVKRYARQDAKLQAKWGEQEDGARRSNL